MTVTVVSEQTTIALTKIAPADDLQYGEEMTLSASASSPSSGPWTGQFTLDIDGIRYDSSRSGPATFWRINLLTLGVHNIDVAYDGDSIHAPARSNAIVQMVTKGNCVLTAFYGAPLSVQYGAQPGIELSLDEFGSGAVPSGNISLYEGNTVLATVFANNAGFSGGLTLLFKLPVLSPGDHFFYFKYVGNAFYNPAQTTVMKYTVLPAPVPARRRGVRH